MKPVRGIIKKSYVVFSGFLDAIKGIVKGDLTIKQTYNFTKGSRDYQKRLREEKEKLEKENLIENVSKIKKYIEEDFCL